MAKHWLSAAAFGTILAGATALAQTAATPPKPADVLIRAKPDQWRVSALPGVVIYGTNDQKVGSITDILLSHDGKAQYVIVGVGGFLGIGKKDVAIPFEAVTFTDQPISRPAPPPDPASPPLAPAPRATAPVGDPMTAATIAPRAAYPDHGTIAMSADQLKAAPAFSFIR